MSEVKKKGTKKVSKNKKNKSNTTSRKNVSAKKKTDQSSLYKQNIIALLLLVAGMVFLLSITTNALGMAGSAIKAILLGQFAKISVLFSILMVFIGVAGLVYSSRFDLRTVSPIMILLSFFGALVFYSAFNLYVVDSKQITFDLLKKVFVDSVVSKNIGIWPYLTGFVLSKWIGRTGMYLLSLGIFLFVGIYYFKMSLSQIGDAGIALASGSREALKNFRKKTVDYITVDDESKEDKSFSKLPEKLDETMFENKFDFLERYKEDISEFTEFENQNLENISDLSSHILEESQSFGSQIGESPQKDKFEIELFLSDEAKEDKGDFEKDYSSKDIFSAENDGSNSKGKEDHSLETSSGDNSTRVFDGLSAQIIQAQHNLKEQVVDNRDLRQKDRIEKENLEQYAFKNEAVSAKAKSRVYTLPPSSLLKSYSLKPKEKSQKIKEVQKLESTLKIYGIEAKVVNISVGPTITRYELQLKIGVKVSKILNLSDDLALAMAAVAPIRIEAPIPGTSLIGIELPNAETDIVSFREMLETKEFVKSNGKIPVALGQDVSGKPIVADITKMPHVLVAGATGAGKSVCINTLICSILYKSKPEEVKMIMIDPKMVELSVYNEIPHLLVPVVTDMKKAPYALSWAVTEMNKRYKLFAENRVRDLDGYNAIPGIEKLPRIVIIVDELADLMMVSPHEVEDSIIRLAQKARACGMHLVIATQRPSVDVITGLIKANIPTRIAFAVSSQVDSRTILDQSGAEKLIGKGDMLFSHPSIAKPQRIQGSFISDDEVNAVVDFILNQGHRMEDKENIIEIGIRQSETEQKEEEEDPLLEEIKSFVMQNKQISTSLIQRRFRIGYNRASRIIDRLEEMRIVSESDGAKPRKVLVSSEGSEEVEG